MANMIIIALIVGVALLMVLFIMSRSSNDAAARQVNKQRTAMAITVTVGAAIGAVLGVAMDNMAFIAIGVSVGVAIGVAREKRLK
ncbi:MAG: hypothetical protein ACYS17_10695 [Planctomycetota bacterium]|jgi:heme/copper-type cytochrome/quinol oxidase subunit 2